MNIFLLEKASTRLTMRNKERNMLLIRHTWDDFEINKMNYFQLEFMNTRLREVGFLIELNR